MEYRVALRVKWKNRAVAMGADGRGNNILWSSAWVKFKGVGYRIRIRNDGTWELMVPR